MVDATKDTFNRIFSIELDEALYEHEKKKFSKFAHISIVQGDSGELLPVILADITQPCLFWLDGHCSSGITAKGELETPITQEPHYILAHFVEEHNLFADDARHLTVQKDYSNIEKLKNMIFKKHPDWSFEVKYDIIRVPGRIQ